jgi:hypothetical protein
MNYAASLPRFWQFKHAHLDCRHHAPLESPEKQKAWLKAFFAKRSS